MPLPLQFAVPARARWTTAWRAIVSESLLRYLPKGIDLSRVGYQWRHSGSLAAMSARQV